MSRAPQKGHVVVVAGPALPGARVEAELVASIHGGGEPLVGPLATVGAVTTAMGGAALVHLAAHGTIRADNPLFSSLLLADGPLTVYDLERLPRGPDTVVLSACDAGRDVVLAGDELLGLSAAFLARETRQVVASVIQIHDAATTSVISVFHSLLSRGKDVAAALSQAQERIAADEDHPAAFAAAAGFVCLGAGFGPLPNLELPPGRP